VESALPALPDPFLPDMAQPTIRREKSGARIGWKNATDAVTATNVNLLIRRQHATGSEDVFEYRRSGQ
jgi:hypothetical protein